MILELLKNGNSVPVYRPFPAGLRRRTLEGFTSPTPLLVERRDDGRRDDVVFVTCSSGRTAAVPGIESMVGLFVNALPVRVRLDGRLQTTAWLQQLQDQPPGLRRCEHGSLAQIQTQSDVPAGQPLFESRYVFENDPTDFTDAPDGASLTIRDVDLRERTNCPLALLVGPGPGIMLRMGQDRGRFDDVVRRRQALLVTVLEGIAADPQRTLAQRPMLGKGDQGQVAQWGTGQPSSGDDLDADFEETIR